MHNIKWEASIGKTVIKDASLNKSIAVISPADNHNFDFNKTVVGIAGNYKVARGATVITDTAAIVTGLTSIAGVALNTEGCNATPAMEGTVLTHKIAGGTLSMYRFRVSSTVNLLVAGDVAGTARWYAIGE